PGGNKKSGKEEEITRNSAMVKRSKSKATAVPKIKSRAKTIRQATSKEDNQSKWQSNGKATAKEEEEQGAKTKAT
ncbi:hypothetical protein BB560_004719, partial [Smittium megazygosporum]